MLQLQRCLITGVLLGCLFATQLHCYILRSPYIFGPPSEQQGVILSALSIPTNANDGPSTNNGNTAIIVPSDINGPLDGGMLAPNNQINNLVPSDPDPSILQPVANGGGGDNNEGPANNGNSGGIPVPVVANGQDDQSNNGQVVVPNFNF